MDYKTRKVLFTKEFNIKTESTGAFILKDKMEDKVALLKIHPNMQPEQFLAYKGYKGLVIEGTGLGHAPINSPNKNSEIHKGIKEALKELINSGTTIAMTSQCLFGRVQMDVYSTGRDLQELGIIPCEDMLPETAFIKLAWILSNDPSDVEAQMKSNLRGEINSCISKSEFLD